VTVVVVVVLRMDENDFVVVYGGRSVYRQIKCNVERG